MYMSLYVIRDKIADECGPVFQAKNDGVARRSVFKYLENVSEVDRDGYSLMRIGGWDNESMKLTQEWPAEPIDIYIPKFDEVEEKK